MSYALYIFDLDGTLFRGDEPIPGAAETLARLRRRGAEIRFLTNNSSQTRDIYLGKLDRLGFEAHRHEIYSSAIGVSAYLTQSDLRRVFVVGEPGLKETLETSGIDADAEAPQAVVVGICKSFTYSLMNSAMQHIRNGAKFIATNADPTYPVEGGRFIPGAGSIVSAITTCSETVPFIVGKPNPFLIELILSDANYDSNQCLVVGDRMDTDIEAGHRAGCQTLLVLTGAVQTAPSDQSWLPSVADLP